MVDHVLDARVSQAGRHVDLAFEGFFGVRNRGGPESGVDQLFHRNDANRDLFVRRQVSGVEQHRSGERLGGLSPELVELVATAQDGARHVLWVSHDP